MSDTYKDRNDIKTPESEDHIRGSTLRRLFSGQDLEIRVASPVFYEEAIQDSGYQLPERNKQP